MVQPLTDLLGQDSRIRVGAQTGDDAGVFMHQGQALVATADFITPVCDDARRFGRVAAANSVSDIYAMGGQPLFALNLCCFPKKVPDEALRGILRGGADVLSEAGAALLGGHTVADAELKYGMAVIGSADPERLLTNTGVRHGDQLVLTKPLGTGVLINAYKMDRMDAAGLEAALVGMERLNAQASALALEFGSQGATDITGFGLAGHALALAQGSRMDLEIDFSALPVHEGFFELVGQGISTGSTSANRGHSEARMTLASGLSSAQQELLFDPQTSGGLLISVASERCEDLLRQLEATGHRARRIGCATAGQGRLRIV